MCWDQSRISLEAATQCTLFGSNSMLPEDTRSIDRIMKGINGSNHRRGSPTATNWSWRPDQVASAALRRGDKKVGQTTREAAT